MQIRDDIQEIGEYIDNNINKQIRMKSLERRSNNMSDITYINQIGRNLLNCTIDFPKEIELQQLLELHKSYKELKGEAFEKLHKFYLNLYRTLSEIDPELLGMPVDKLVYPVDKSKYDKCVEKVLKFLLIIYAIGFTGDYREDGSILVNRQELMDLSKKLKVNSVYNIFEKLNKLGINIIEQDAGDLVVRFINDDGGFIAKSHCFYTKYICKDKAEDKKLISKYLRSDFTQLSSTKLKKQPEKDEKYITATLPENKVHMLKEILRILREEMDCRVEVKNSEYKGILKGAFSAAYKSRKTGRTIVSMDTEAVGIVLRLNFTTQTLSKVFQAADEFPTEIFDNIKKCYCKGEECMGHKGVYIPEAEMSFCNHIIRYELCDLNKQTVKDFIRLLRLQYKLLMESMEETK